MADKDSLTVAFRLTNDEYDEAKRIAAMASKHGILRNDSVSTLAKACLFVRINEWKQIEYQHQLEQEKANA